MGTMKVPLPDSLESFVNEQVRSRGYWTSREYVRELIRKDRDRQRLRSLLVEGASFPPGSIADRAYFDAHAPARAHRFRRILCPGKEAANWLVA
jgi:antitoxin ParD1/3/4